MIIYSINAGCLARQAFAQFARSTFARPRWSCGRNKTFITSSVSRANYAIKGELERLKILQNLNPIFTN